eukprot:gene18914-6274_t
MEEGAIRGINSATPEKVIVAGGSVGSTDEESTRYSFTPKSTHEDAIVVICFFSTARVYSSIFHGFLPYSITEGEITKVRQSVFGLDITQEKGMHTTTNENIDGEKMTRAIAEINERDAVE